MTKVPSIAEWLSGKNILVTGSTGYIGKVLVEKILRSCSNVNRIYLILRPKKGKTVEDRFQDLLKSDLWTYSNFDYDFGKLVPIEGDFSVVGMGLSEENIKIIHENVHIVFHGAASIKFTDTFDQAVKSNTRLTRDMIELAKGMKQLELFVQISTAYVNSNRTEIEEKVYPPSMDWRKVIQLAETANPMELNAVTISALGDFPNTYTFTKNMAEHVVWDHRHDLPILIYRPVIVVSLAREPTTGWSDNVSGPEIVYYAVGKGLIRILNLGKTSRYNMCPGDVTINGMLIAAWKAACHSKVTGQPAASVVSSIYSNVPSGVMFDRGAKAVCQNPLPDAMWLEYYFFVTNQYLFLILHLMFNLLPALLVQTVAKIAGKDLHLAKALRIYYVSQSNLLRYFTKIQFNMNYDNFIEAVKELSPEDKIIYNTTLIDEDEGTIELVKKSVERFMFLLKERKLTLKQRQEQRRRLIMIDQIGRILLLVLILYYIPYQSIFDFCAANFL